MSSNAHVQSLVVRSVTIRSTDQIYQRSDDALYSYIQSKIENPVPYLRGHSMAIAWKCWRSSNVVTFCAVMSGSSSFGNAAVKHFEKRDLVDRAAGE